MERKGIQSGTLSITTIEPVVLEGEGTPQETETEKESEKQTEMEKESENQAETETESQEQTETESQEQTETEKESEDQTETGTQPDPGDSGDMGKPGEQETPEDLFDSKAVPELKLSQALPGSGYINFSWSEIAGADGYELYKVTSADAATLVVETASGKSTEYEKSCGYNESFSFKVRAFRMNADKTAKTYGEFSQVQTIQTPAKTLDKVTKVTASAAQGSKKITLTWKKMSKAGGYRIFMLNEKTGEFESVRTISGTKATSYTVTKAYAKTYTFRIAAYESDKKGNPTVFGNYSDAVSVTTSPGKPSGLTVKSKTKKKAEISWKKVTGAEGYQVYRSTSKNGKYTKVKTIKKLDKVDCTDTGVTSKKTYYYKVRAYLKGADGKTVYGSYSDPKKVKIK